MKVEICVIFLISTVFSEPCVTPSIQNQCEVLSGYRTANGYLNEHYSAQPNVVVGTKCNPNTCKLYYYCAKRGCKVSENSNITTHSMCLRVSSITEDYDRYLPPGLKQISSDCFAREETKERICEAGQIRYEIYDGIRNCTQYNSLDGYCTALKIHFNCFIETTIRMISCFIAKDTTNCYTDLQNDYLEGSAF
jgi:hypothetical protein